MKKWSTTISAALLGAALILPYSDAAAAAERPVRVYLDGKAISFEVQPVLENGTTLVQFRPIFEKMGLTVGWDGETQTVTGTKDGLTIELVIDQTAAYVNGQPYELELAPRLVNGNTLVPLRFVSESCGKEVSWVQSTSSVYLKSPAPPKQTPGSSGNTGSPGSAGSPGTANPPSNGDGAGTEDPTKPVRGEYQFPNGDKYTGPLVNGLPEGRGKVVSSSGKLLFDGTMKAGVPWNGRAKTYYDNGELESDGTLKEGVLSGTVKQYSADGQLVFNGTFVNGERATGTLYYDNGNKYTGPFEDNEPSGTGKLVYKNGDTYEGEFVFGKRDGKGTYTTAKGEKIVGDFKDDAMNGIISYYDKKGTLLSISEYANDVLVRKVDMGSESALPPNTNPTSSGNALSSENDRHEKALKELKDAYDRDRKQIEDEIAQIRKDNPGLYASQTAYDKALKEAEDKQDEIVEKMNSLSNDTSLAGKAAMAELEKQLADNQALTAQIVKKGAAQKQLEKLNDRLASLREDYNDKLKSENDRHLSIIKQFK
ncbi:copper amine oxidase N-terminal domain-containing protein [Paenibacillus hamazuiensis]|uniref:copper amine oxidase N-terminal domain-containing protein n=1 Tax=Paenibacillus hamazuiensis TaxID=2936508 RepID=UPI00200FEB13|nr:copper amine oxidase N-terminal domain-containing protein [Paenibacillus hamazuiensis]